jgi:hypothetical protein
MPFFCLFYINLIREFERLSHEGLKIGEEVETSDVSAGPVRRKSRSGPFQEAELSTVSPRSSPRSGPQASRAEEEEEMGDDNDADDTSCGVEEEGQAPKASDMLVKESKV